MNLIPRKYCKITIKQTFDWIIYMEMYKMVNGLQIKLNFRSIEISFFSGTKDWPWSDHFLLTRSSKEKDSTYDPTGP